MGLCCPLSSWFFSGSGPLSFASYMNVFRWTWWLLYTWFSVAVSGLVCHSGPSACYSRRWLGYLFDRLWYHGTSAVGCAQVGVSTRGSVVESDLPFRPWITDGRRIAMKIRNPTQLLENENGRNDVKIACPNCDYEIDNSHVTQEWPGLPSGVKFEPSDEQLVGHLAAKVGIGKSSPHPLINEFILTIEERNGICYTHPENLPGVKQDGSSTHFFHRTSKAYTTGTRKRRKVDNFRWHKTGETEKVCENGEQVGCKKRMVLYTIPSKGSKSVKTNWVMHQYHLGTEDEKEDEFVVSKIRLKQCDKNDPGIPKEEDAGTSNSKGDPSTPTTSTPQPCSKKQHSCLDRIVEEHMFRASSPQAADLDPKFHLPSKPIEAECDGQIYIRGVTSWLAGKSQCFEDSQKQMVGHFSCEEILGSGSCQENVEETNNIPGLSDCGRIGGNGHEKEMHQTSYYDLANLDFDTPPDGPIPFVDSQFSSQESLLGWLENFGNSQ